MNVTNRIHEKANYLRELEAKVSLFCSLPNFFVFLHFTVYKHSYHLRDMTLQLYMLIYGCFWCEGFWYPKAYSEEPTDAWFRECFFWRCCPAIFVGSSMFSFLRSNVTSILSLNLLLKMLKSLFCLKELK